MRKLIVALAFVVSAGSLVSCKEGNAASKVKKENVVKAEKRDHNISEGAAVIKFDKQEFDFGTVNEGDIVETSFTVTNTGKSNLVITRVQPSCGCTAPEWPKEAIAPGESGVVKAKFNTSGKANKQLKTLTLYTNTAKGREVLKLSGMVIPKVKKVNKVKA